MFAFLARAAGVALLALAVVLAVLDLTRSVASSQLTTTSLDATWTQVSPTTRASAEATVSGRVGETVWSVLGTLLALPGWFVFLALASLLLWIGRKRRSAYARFARE